MFWGRFCRMYGLAVIASVPPSTTSKTINKIDVHTHVLFYFFQMKEHEKALRIFVHNIGDFAEAEQYCNQITLDQPRREKETLLLLFLTVLLDTAATKRYVRLLYNAQTTDTQRLNP